MDTTEVADRIIAQLRAAGTPERAAVDRAYLKSDLEHWGVSVGKARAAARIAGRRVPHDDLIALVGQLWGLGPYDTRLAAAVLLDGHARVLGAADLPLLEELLRAARTWALVDLIAPRPLAAVDAADPRAATVAFDQWITDPDFWLRRAALLAHLIGLRTGLAGWPRFSRYADAVLADREFFVRKATGWVLRETARHDPELVRDWLRPRTDRISGVALREAVKPLAAPDREALLDAYRRRAALRRG